MKTKTKTKSKKRRLYLVPTIVQCTFGCELEVMATSPEEAEKLVREGKGQMPSGDGYDWDRFTEESYDIGDWQPVRRADS